MGQRKQALYKASTTRWHTQMQLGSKIPANMIVQVEWSRIQMAHILIYSHPRVEYESMMLLKTLLFDYLVFLYICWKARLYSSPGGLLYIKWIVWDAGTLETIRMTLQQPASPVFTY